MAARDRPAGPGFRNHLLAALPSRLRAALRRRLQPVTLTVPHLLYEAGERIDTVYFIETGWVSMIARLEDGEAAEVGMVGPEGMIGTPLLFDDDVSPVAVMVQGGGAALRLDAAGFRKALRDSRAMRHRLLRYAMAFQAQVMQTAACNGRHGLRERLARWLLMAHDRVEGDRILLTHEFLSMMLGVRRSGVTIAARALQDAGLIRYARGHITVLDRAGLEAASCGCYAAVLREYARLHGAAAGSRAAAAPEVR